MLLTELALKNLKPKNKTFRVADSAGLCIEVSPAGGKLWRYRYRFQGKEQMFALGKYPGVSLAAARKLRDKAKELADKGKHLTREKKAAKQRRSVESQTTFEVIAREWHTIKKPGLNEKYHADRLTRMERVVFPKIGALPINEVSVPDVVKVIQLIGLKGTIETAKRTKADISQVFRYAVQKGACMQNPAGDIRDILPRQTKKHHACISKEEFPDLLKKLETCQPSMSLYATKLLALTFVRTSELLGAKWDEIDWKKKEWRIPGKRMKMRRPHIVPLSKQAIKILKELQERTSATAFIFYSSGSKSRYISNTTILRLLKRLKYDKRMTGHGFRTIASTILNERGYNPDAIERQLAHEDRDSVRSAYNRAEYLFERKKMMQEYADILDEQRVSKNEYKKSFKLISLNKNPTKA